MRLVQIMTEDGERRVGMVEPAAGSIRLIDGSHTVLGLAERAIAKGQSLADQVQAQLGSDLIDYSDALSAGRVLAPVDHPEPARFWITGTGLTHLGSAQVRDRMHEIARSSDGELTDSMKIFRMGVEGGKPAEGEIGVQPEWFFKGVGTCVVPPEAPLVMPEFALAGAEEAEIVGLYLNDPDGNPWRLGFTLGNEFSDHVTEAINYMYVAHSKLRVCSIGPELLVGDLPSHVEGTVRIMRDDQPLWQGQFLSGENNMSHSLRNLEHHHFKYSMFRRPGDLHAFFFGADVMSCAHGVKTKAGDRFEIDVPVFGRPLRNTLTQASEETFLIRSL
ncbi:AraD1 family protein [Chelativorans sp. YIM 93263]|uniref:AraD1 family protein n=1 Tax=Chelativorans sp. YIM 93263 TaxID=2906648 RepID=UPI002379B210|nr:AraD1 family protein [Chelativorans sp. YIM 93263]